MGNTEVKEYDYLKLGSALLYRSKLSRKRKKFSNKVGEYLDIVCIAHILIFTLLQNVRIGYCSAELLLSYWKIGLFQS